MCTTYNRHLLPRSSRPPKNRRRSDRWPQKAKKVRNPRPAPLVASQGLSNFVGFTWIGLQKRPPIPPLNIAIIPWRLLGHTVFVLKAGSHLRVQYRMKSCIQSCAGVKKIFKTLQTHTAFLLFIAASIQYRLDSQTQGRVYFLQLQCWG